MAKELQNFVLPWIEGFGDIEMPKDLLALLSLIFMNNLHDEGDISDCFNLDIDRLTDNWVDDWSDDEEFLAQLYPFAKANGTGSTYAIWHYDKSLSLDNMPIVIFGDEGGEHVIAENLPKLFQLLTYDAQPSVDDDGVFCLRNDEIDEEYIPSYYHDEFIAWVAEHYGLSAVEDSDQASKIIADAQERYGEKFKQWCSQYFDED